MSSNPSSAYFRDAAEASATLGAFLHRLADVEPVLRRLTGGEPMLVLLTIEEPDLELMLDFASRPIRVLDSIASGRGAMSRIGIVTTADVMHKLLLGQMLAARALDERRLLLRGSMALVARFLPLLDLTPTLYADHLRRIGRADLIAPRGAVHPGAYARNLEFADKGVDAMARRVWTAWVGRSFVRLGQRLRIDERPRLSRATRAALRASAYGAGWLVGALQRVQPSLSLFDMMQAMGDGLDRSERATRPAREPGRDGGG
jgi:hypothetical protein